MKIKQVVQVEILGAYRPYTYSWYFDPGAGEMSLGIGDKVELPPNQVQEEGSSGTVCRLGSDYDGPMKDIVRVIKRAHDDAGPDEVELRRPADEDLWGGFGEGDYA
jgi:hypothetical protein